jgi:hypothetical protein
MTDEELRTLVREAIRRYAGQDVPRGAAGEAASAHDARSDPRAPAWRSHPSFGRFLVPAGEEDGGPCLIEPSVRCNHCGFCQSYGH